MTRKNGNVPSLEQSNQAKRMSLAEWRASRLHDLDLPSGLQVKVRDVTMTDLMLTGKLPPAIFDLARDAAEKGEREFDLKALAQGSADFNQMLNTLVEICLVEPKIGEIADEDHILLAEMPADDKMAIFNFVNREADPVKSFREG